MSTDRSEWYDSGSLANAVKNPTSARQARTGNGAGVIMYTQYTVTADPNFDTGLREAGGDPRPVFDTFVGLKGFDPRDPLPSTWRPEDDAFVPMPGGDGRVEPPWV